MMYLSIGGERRDVGDLEEASKAFRAYVDGNGLGASDLRRDDGTLRVRGKVVARVSYNGRVWSVGRTAGQARLLFDPRPAAVAS